MNSVGTITVVVDITNVLNFWVGEQGKNGSKVVPTNDLVIPISIFSLDVEITKLTSDSFEQIIHFLKGWTLHLASRGN